MQQHCESQHNSCLEHAILSDSIRCWDLIYVDHIVDALWKKHLVVLFPDNILLLLLNIIICSELCI